MPWPLLHHSELAWPYSRAGLRLDPVQNLAQYHLPQEAALQAGAVRQSPQQLHHVGPCCWLGPQRSCLLCRSLQPQPLALLGFPGQGLLPRLALLLGAQLCLGLLAGQHLHGEVSVQQRNVLLRLERTDHELVGHTIVPDGEPITLGQRRVAAESLLENVLQVHPHGARTTDVEALAPRLQLCETLGAAGQAEVAHLHLAHCGQRVQAGALGEAKCYAWWNTDGALLGCELCHTSVSGAKRRRARPTLCSTTVGARDGKGQERAALQRALALELLQS
mmetsp:Transcript_34048/g.68763  ORF Transcript_34048/g.68763 Transcript_34048/m.68763 type:complete len:277 (-) Transcript_34048:401-1231(-)